MIVHIGDLSYLYNCKGILCLEINNETAADIKIIILFGNDIPFKGQMIILGRDFKQALSIC